MILRVCICRPILFCTQRCSCDIVNREVEFIISCDFTAHNLLDYMSMDFSGCIVGICVNRNRGMRC